MTYVPRRSIAFCILLGVTPAAVAGSNCVAPGDEAPTFMVQRWIAANDWTVHYYQPPSEGPFVVDDDIVAAEVSCDDGIWELELVPASGVSLRAVVFPARLERQPLDHDISDDRYYFPLIAGAVEHALSRNVDFADVFMRAWPGDAFAPLVIMADDDQARLIAAANWPPIPVAPAYHAQRLELWYPGPSGLSGALWTAAWRTPCPPQARK